MRPRWPWAMNTGTRSEEPAPAIPPLGDPPVGEEPPVPDLPPRSVTAPPFPASAGGSPPSPFSPPIDPPPDGVPAGTPPPAEGAPPTEVPPEPLGSLPPCSAGSLPPVALPPIAAPRPPVGSRRRSRSTSLFGSSSQLAAVPRTTTSSAVWMPRAMLPEHDVLLSGVPQVVESPRKPVPACTSLALRAQVRDRQHALTRRAPAPLDGAFRNLPAIVRRSKRPDEPRVSACAVARRPRHARADCASPSRSLRVPAPSRACRAH
jgi:hypothetical protein